MCVCPHVPCLWTGVRVFTHVPCLWTGVRVHMYHVCGLVCVPTCTMSRGWIFLAITAQTLPAHSDHKDLVQSLVTSDDSILHPLSAYSRDNPFSSLKSYNDMVYPFLVCELCALSLSDWIHGSCDDRGNHSYLFVRCYMTLLSMCIWSQ